MARSNDTTLRPWSVAPQRWFSTRGRRWLALLRRRWLASLLVVSVVVLFAAGLAVWTTPSLLRTGSREPLPAMRPTSELSEVCSSSLHRGFCGDALRLEEDLRHAPIRFVESAVAGEGVTKPQRALIELGRPGEVVTLYVKWKAFPASLDETNNSPRRELAAYALSSLVLGPADHVVPPTVVRCIPLDETGALLDTEPFEGAQCAMGVLSYWLVDARELTEEMQETASPAFARNLGDLRLVTYLAEHRDGIGQNMLVIGAPEPLRAFAVDNGITFGERSLHPLGILGGAWAELDSGTLRHATRERLQSLSDEDWMKLATLAQLTLSDEGIYEPVTLEPPFDGQADRGVRWSSRSLQLGLTTEEIDEVRARAEEIVSSVGDASLR